MKGLGAAALMCLCAFDEAYALLDRAHFAKTTLDFARAKRAALQARRERQRSSSSSNHGIARRQQVSPLPQSGATSPETAAPLVGSVEMWSMTSSKKRAITAGSKLGVFQSELNLYGDITANTTEPGATLTFEQAGSWNNEPLYNIKWPAASQWGQYLVATQSIQDLATGSAAFFALGNSVPALSASKASGNSDTNFGSSGQQSAIWQLSSDGSTSAANALSAVWTDSDGSQVLATICTYSDPNTSGMLFLSLASCPDPNMTGYATAPVQLKFIPSPS